MLHHVFFRGCRRFGGPQAAEEKAYSLNELVFDPRNRPRTSENSPHDENAEMEAEILQMIGGSPGSGHKPGPRKLLCSVVTKEPSASPGRQDHTAPFKGRLLFLKVYDTLFWHRPVDFTKRAA
ncbi:hypothetical protein LX36DRAFT_713650 [Colletotrichum falcatum]|nr:hypothetical protein LX36DRAFT_713650 [Colletotrichum falcatum]